MKNWILINTSSLLLLTFFTSQLSAADAAIPLIDLSQRAEFQVLVDQEANQYLGHPTTVLLEDGKTILCVYPKGHGKGPIVYKRSTDGGKTWSERLPTPENWSTSLETPTIHRVIDQQGRKRLIVFSGLYPIRMSVSEDDGLNWTPLKPIGEKPFGGIVAMGTVIPLKKIGHYLALFHDDGRFFRPGDKNYSSKGFIVYKTLSTDGGLTWQEPEIVTTQPDAHLCEPGHIRSPDGKEIAVLLRENSRKKNSMIIFSQDEGLTWTKPVEMPPTLKGDRHTAIFLPDGKIFVSFRDMNPNYKDTYGDWVAWVGTYQDLKTQQQGSLRVRLMDNTNKTDCAYPGVELLPDGTIVTTTYGHWTAGKPPYIMSVRIPTKILQHSAQ